MWETEVSDGRCRRDEQLSCVSRGAERPPESRAARSLHPPHQLKRRRAGLSASTGRHVTAGRPARLRAARPPRGARGTPPPASPRTAPFRTPGRCAPRQSRRSWGLHAGAAGKLCFEKQILLVIGLVREKNKTGLIHSHCRR